MQYSKRKINKKRLGQLIAVILSVVLIVGIIVFVTGMKKSGGVSAALLPCTADQQISTMGGDIVYYDGMSVQCVNGGGSPRWSFSVGYNAGFDAGNNAVASWVSNQLYILDSNGKPTYNDTLAGQVQFATVGDRYVAAVVGDEISPTLLIKDLQGNPVDEETDAYKNLLLLDVGFFGSSGQYMWTLALDVYSTGANTVLNIYEVGKMNAGKVSLGEYLTYDVVYTGSEIDVFSTRRMRVFTTKGTETAASAQLIYGWKMMDYEITSNKGAIYVLGPTNETTGSTVLRELRLMNGDTDKRYSLPAVCCGAVVYNRQIYAFGTGVMYKAGLSSNAFTSYTLPVSSAVTRYLCKTQDGKVILACGEAVYAVTLP